MKRDIYFFELHRYMYDENIVSVATDVLMHRRLVAKVDFGEVSYQLCNLRIVRNLIDKVANLSWLSPMY